MKAPHNGVTTKRSLIISKVTSTEKRGDMNNYTKENESDAVRLRERGSMRPVLLVVIAVAVIATLWLLPLRQYVTNVLLWTEGLGPWGPVALALFYIVACVAFLPGSIITLGAGLLFGVWTGFITVWVGANLGACAAFLVGRTLARDRVAKKVAGNRKFAAIDRAVGQEGFKIVFLLRLSPVFPFNLLNYALGLTNVPFSKYALASLIGMIPGTLLYVYIGSAARSLAEVAAGNVQGGVASKVFFLVGLVVTFLVVLLVTRVARRSLAAAEAEQAREEKTTEESPPPTFDRDVEVLPADDHNRELVANTHPRDWTNPEPAVRYNLVVIGAGTAGLVSAAGAAGLGAKTALVERALLGGDCLNVGCVPSKSIIRSSRLVGEIARASEYGIKIPDGVEVDFPAVMERMRRIRARISRHDSAERFRGLGVDVFLGHARFTGPDTVEVEGKTLRFKKAVIATGARAVEPDLEGLTEAGFLTNETVFSLTDRPGRLAVIGGGPIGCEMAQAFQRLGSQVVLFHRHDHILDREDSDAAEIVQNRFIEEGIRLVLNARLLRVETHDREKILHYSADGEEGSITVDEILVGAGRQPNTQGLGLEAAGVDYDQRKGVLVDDRLQTTNPNIYAAGDICMRYKFTHAADAAARIVIQNTLFMGRKRLSALTVPWCTYTVPEIAHVGMYEKDAKELGIETDTFTRPLADVDRAVADGEEDGFVKIHVEKGKDRILGATIVASHAGDMISEVTVAMVGKLGLGALAGVIHPYPTQAEAIKHTADAYNRTRLTPFVKGLFEKWLSRTR
jgi:pyruvate/2-oxoglutarate dehydrogenase complex dihydrolipoamide dehydrogenase (E3) component/uncharacterized membrane protein YdjX (TVP38/TMEM64 family)